VLVDSLIAEPGVESTGISRDSTSNRLLVVQQRQEDTMSRKFRFACTFLITFLVFIAWNKSSDLDEAWSSNTVTVKSGNGMLISGTTMCKTLYPTEIDLSL